MPTTWTTATTGRPSWRPGSTRSPTGTSPPASSPPRAARAGPGAIPSPCARPPDLGFRLLRRGLSGKLAPRLVQLLGIAAYGEGLLEHAQQVARLRRVDHRQGLRFGAVEH